MPVEAFSCDAWDFLATINGQESWLFAVVGLQRHASSAVRARGFRALSLIPDIVKAMHAPLKPPVVHISRPNSATASSQSTTPAASSAPARPANAPGFRSGRPTSCSPVARRRDLVPQQIIQPQTRPEVIPPTRAVAAHHVTALGGQYQQQSGCRPESAHEPFDEDKEGESPSVFEATLARKEAEAAVQQLARRIAHYRSQEERVLREVWSAKRALEVSLAASEQDVKPVDEAAPMISPSRRHNQASMHPNGDVRAQTAIPPVHPDRERVRARDHLQFLSRQKRILQKRKQEAVRRQKEKAQSALAQQKMRLEAEAELRRAQKERIRADEFQLAANREAKQRRVAEVQEVRRNERLSVEREREQHARALLQDMLDEERNLSLRLEALKMHQSQLAPFVSHSSTSFKG